MESGHILDDDIVNMLVKPMPENVTVTVLMDCCHSGTVLDLPYKFSANDTEFRREDGFDLTVVSEPIRSDRASAHRFAQPKRREKEKSGGNDVDEEDDKPKKKSNSSKEDLAPDAPIGPRKDEYGNPVLPVRYAKEPDEEDENDDDEEEGEDGNDEEGEDNKNNKKDEEEEAPAVKPKKKGLLARLFGRRKKKEKKETETKEEEKVPEEV